MEEIQRELEMFDFWTLMYKRTEDKLNIAILDENITLAQYKQLMNDYEFARYKAKQCIELPW